MEGREERRDFSFGWLNVTQFLGALNDNIYRYLIVFLLIKILGQENAHRIVAKAGAVFVIPFLLFSHAGGVLADRHSKRTIVVLMKGLEIVAMLLGAAAFLARSPGLLYATLFLMATQSAIFGPSKYGIIPELVGKTRLSRANSLIVTFTFMAIIIGTPLAGILSTLFESRFVFTSFFCILIAAAGLAASRNIRKTPPAGERGRFTPYFLLEIWKSVRQIQKDGYLFLAVMGSAYFMLIGAFVQFNIIPYGIGRFGLSEEVSSQFFLLAAFGIGFGSFLSGRLSGRNIEFGVVPMGAFGMTITNILMHYLPRSPWMAGVLVFFMGVSAGLFIVPLNAFIQFRSPKRSLGKILATKNFLDFFSVLIASGLIYFLGVVLGLSASKGFLFVGVITLLLTLVTLFLLPDFFLRFVGVVVMRLGYRIRVFGSENIPFEGAALLICNHVSWVDALLLMATQQRRIRFVMYREIYEKRLLKPLFQLMGVIPISYTDSPRKMLDSLKKARAVMDEGYMVCIFAEGSVTRTGQMQEFRRGFERIVKGRDYPIIPIYIGGAWGSILSYYHGRLLSRLPSLVPYRISIVIGEPMPSSSTAVEVKLKVMELAGRSFDLEKPRRRPLGAMFIHTARRNWFRRAMTDTLGRKLCYGKTLIAALALSSKIRALSGGQRNVGILLPSSVGAALANISVSLLGKVPVNLNFTASEEAIRSAVSQAGLKTIISSRRFLDKMKNLREPEGTVYLEDIAGEIRMGARVRALVKALFYPVFLLAGSSGFSADDPAAIIFSSGTTGTPKGIVLSHHNIISNIEQMRMVFGISPTDNICGILPFFHSFGFTVTLWLPMVSGFSAGFHANPLEADKVIRVIRENRSTLLVATPTFLSLYMRKAAPEDLQSLEWVVVGGEKLRRPLAGRFEQKYGIQPLEGYGATEMSPVVSFNLPDVEIDGVYQKGRKIGSVGHPLPGITMKIVDPDTGETLPVGETGLLFLKGPNVMTGYLNNPDKTAETVQDGWYNTRDIARMDPDGFITITDRLSRFSKIGGEMVPHLAVEDELLRGIEPSEPVLAVTSLPDEKKGEKLIVLFTEKAGPGENLIGKLNQANLPTLWKPRPENFYKIDSLPVLGTGKISFRELKKLAETCVRENSG